MTAVSQPPLPPADVQPPAAAATELKGRGFQPAIAVTDGGRSTPSFLRRWNVILLVLVAAFAVVGSISSLIMRSASLTTAQSTAPALIGVQDLFASVAEANAAATAAFLTTRTSGAEDRLNRNLYEDAIRRASEQTEEVSAIIGSDEQAHEALKDIGVALNAYSGQIASAQLANANELSFADRQLREAIRVVQDDVGLSVQTVTERGQTQLDEERTTGRFLTWAAVALGVITVLALIIVQSGLLQRTNRIFNPLLVLASLLILAVLAMLVIGPMARSQSLDDATDGGYEAIATTSNIQTAAYNLQSQLSLTLLEENDADLAVLFDQVSDEIDNLIAGADSSREQAAATALSLRWTNYKPIAMQIAAKAERGDLDGAVEQFQGDGISAFNGLNTAIESALSDNRAQFTSGVDQAAEAVNITPLASIVLPVLAALASLWAIQRRLGEYR